MSLIRPDHFMKIRYYLEYVFHSSTLTSLQWLTRFFKINHRNLTILTFYDYLVEKTNCLITIVLEGCFYHYDGNQQNNLAQTFAIVLFKDCLAEYEHPFTNRYDIVGKQLVITRTVKWRYFTCIRFHVLFFMTLKKFDKNRENSHGQNSWFSKWKILLFRR